MNKYLARLLIFSLLLGALPTVVTGAASYYIAARDIELKVRESNMLLLQQTQMRVEQSLQIMEKSATQFIHSALTRSVMNRSLGAVDFVTVRQLTTELTNLQTTAPINQAYLVNFKHDWSISLEALKKLSETEQFAAFLAYAKHADSVFWSTRNIEPGIGDGTLAGVSGDDEDSEPPVHSLNLIYKIPILPKTERPQGLLAVSISVAEIKTALTSSVRTGNSYILDRAAAPILSSDMENVIYRDVNKKIANRVESGQNEGFFRTSADGRDVGVLFRTSSYNGWTYVTVVPIAEMMIEPGKIAALTALICAVILLVVFAMAYFGTRRMYRPIRSLLRFTAELETSATDKDSLIGTDEIQFIRERLQSLAVIRAQLNKHMERQTGQLKEFFLLKLFTGQLNDDDFIERYRLSGLPAKWHRLAVLALQIDNLQDTRYQEQDRELLLFAINNIVGELLPAAERFSPIVLDDAQITLLAEVQEAEPDESKENFYRTAELIREQVERYLQLRVSIGISRPFKHLSDASAAYRESLAALNCRISLGPEIILHYEDIDLDRQTETVVYAPLKTIEDALLQAVRESRLDQAMEQLRRYLDAVLHKDGLAGEYRIIILQLLAKLVGIVQEQGISVKKVLGGEVSLERLLKLQTREEMERWFEKRLITPIVQELRVKADTQYMNIADRLVTIIHEQYDRDITLESCASALNFHPVYLGRVFKKKVGVPFSDYLSEYRMNKAKQLLESTTLKVSEIGEKLQYKNISAFIRSFRKTYGMTPGQYRETLERRQ